MIVVSHLSQWESEKLLLFLNKTHHNKHYFIIICNVKNYWTDYVNIQRKLLKKLSEKFWSTAIAITYVWDWKSALDFHQPSYGHDTNHEVCAITFNHVKSDIWRTCQNSVCVCVLLSIIFKASDFMTHTLWYMFLCGSVVEHCVSSAKGCGFDSQGTHILTKMYSLNAM